MVKEAYFPLFSVIVTITDQNVHLLSYTLDSIAAQAFDSFEVIVIDGQTKGHCLSILDTYRTHVKKIYTALNRNLSAMFNRGVDVAEGQYIHFLQPGEFYISRNAFRFLKDFIEQNSSPDLIYTGCVVRHSLAPPQQLFKQIEKEDLKGAGIPQSLQAYWFKKKAIQLCGKFDIRYQIQGGFDLICRLYHDLTLRKLFMRRILTDYEYRLAKPKWILWQLYETLLIIFRQFGLSKAALFWMAQNNMRLIRWWSKNVKGAFWKRHSI